MEMMLMNMKLKIRHIWDKYQLIILIALLALVISVIGVIVFKFIFKPKVNLEHYTNSIYSIQYDSNWEVVDSTDTTASLEYNEDANIKFEITTLTNDYLYMSLENIVEEVSYSIQQANPNYYLIGKQSISVTTKQYDGYQLLYENGENEVLLTLFRKEDKIVSIIYEADYEYFDILLDGVKDIIHNFELLDVEYANTYNLLEVNSEDLSLTGNFDIDISESKTYEIADKHYIVEFEVPSQFKRRVFNSRYGMLSYEGITDGNIDLTASVYNYNLYEILAELKNHTFDYSIKSAVKEGAVTKEAYTKLNEDKYIYHVMYSAYGNEYDVAYLIYELDYRRVFVIKLTGTNAYLDEAIVDYTNVISTTKYADYVYRNVEDGKVINEMKFAFTDYTDYERKYSQVTLRTPEAYMEYDNGFSNVYEERTFKNKYNEEKDDYDFEVKYSITSLSIESSLNVLESVYYDASNRVNVGNKTYNDMKFKVYSYDYKKGGTKNYVSVLFYKLESGNYLRIVIESKGSKIKESEIIELIDFEENIYTMN